MSYDITLAKRPNKVVYKDGDTVLKIFNEDFSKSDVLNEALNQSRVEETGLHIPKVLEVMKIDGKWAIRTEYVPGKTLQQLIDENPDKKDEYLETLVDLQMLVHSKRSPLLNKLKDKMNRKIDQTKLDATTRYELHTLLESMPKHSKVCHGDFNPSNIIIADEDGTPYIPRLVSRHSGQRIRRCCQNVSSVLACGRQGNRRKIPEALLQKERYRTSVR